MTWLAFHTSSAAPGRAPRLRLALAQALGGLRRALPRCRPRQCAPRPAVAHLSLPPGQALTLRRGTGRALGHAGALRVEVLSGRVWLTCSGHAVDHMLVRGQRLDLAAPGRVVVQAMSRETAWLRVWPAGARR